MFGFPGEKLAFSTENQFFSRKELVFQSKTIFFLGKVGFLVQHHLLSCWFSPKNQFFPRETKKHIFGVWPYSLPKDGFLFFPRKG